MSIKFPEVQPALNRRDFLKYVGALVGLLAISNLAVTNDQLGKSVPREDLNFPSDETVYSREQIAWFAKPWVLVNMLLAAKKLDGVVIKPGQKVSLIDLLKLREQTDDGNTDPEKGFVAGMSMSGKIYGAGLGLCLAATVLFRALLKSPLSVSAQTHYEPAEGFFDNQWPRGTDAAVYSPSAGDTSKIPEVDLTFQNNTNAPMTLRFTVLDDEGKPVKMPSKEEIEKAYRYSLLNLVLESIRASLKKHTQVSLPLMEFPEAAGPAITKIHVVAELRSDQEIGFKSTISPITQVQGDPNNMTFTRTLDLGNGNVFSETFTSQYRPPEN